MLGTRVFLAVVIYLILQPVELGGQPSDLDTLALRLSDLVFDHDEEAARIVDSMYSIKAGYHHKAFQHTLGNYYFLSAQYDSAFVAFQRALKLAVVEGDSSRILSLNNNLGVALMELGRISEAIAYLTETLNRRLQMADTARVLSGYGNLIEAYQILEAREKVILLLQEAESWQVDSEAYAYPLRRLHMLASFHHFKYGDNQKALRHLKATARLNAYIQDDRFKAEYLLSLARVYFRLNRQESALEALNEAIVLFEETNFKGGLTGAYLEKAHYFFEQKDYKRALEYYRKAQSAVQAPDMKLSIYTGLKEVLMQQGDYQRALQYTDSIINLKDSLQGLDVQKAVFDIESRYKLKEKENEIRALNDEAKIARLEAERADLKAKRLNNWLWSGGGIALVLLLFLTGLYRNSRLQKEASLLKADLEAKKFRLEKQSLQLQLFRSQINPHFLFNALYAIQSFVLTNKALESSRYLGQFAQLMRSVLELNEKEFISLEQELSILKNYLSLERLRFDERFEFHIQCPKHLLERDIPAMILQPFAENAVVHGFSELEEGGLLNIIISEKAAGILSIQIIDNGKGFDAEQKKPHPAKRSMALKLTQQRFDLLIAENKGPFKFEVKSRSQWDGKQGTVVLLEIKSP